MSTINISLPTKMYQDAKASLHARGYASISELIRHALRDVLYPVKTTENGFTPEFEEEVLRSAAEPIEDSVEWDGKTPFTEFVLTHPPKHARYKVHQSVPRSRTKIARVTPRARVRHQSTRLVVPEKSQRFASA